MTSLGRRVRRSVVVGGMVHGMTTSRFARDVCGFSAAHLLHDFRTCMAWLCTLRPFPFFTSSVGWCELSGGCFLCACATEQTAMSNLCHHHHQVTKVFCSKYCIAGALPARGPCNLLFSCRFRKICPSGTQYEYYPSSIPLL